MKRFRGYELALGFLAATVFWVAVAIINTQYNAHEQTTGHNAQPQSVSEAEAETNKRIADYGEALDVLTGFLVIANLGLWAVTWRASVRQSGDMETSIDAAKEASQRQMRAYVFITDGGFVSFNINNQKFRILVRLRNSGLSPGYEFSTWIGGEDHLVEATPFPTETKALADRGAASIIGPGESVSIDSVDNPIHGFIVQAIRDGFLGLFVWGGCDYTDAFGKRWSFIFRMRIAGPEATFDDSGNLVWPLKPHQIGYTETEIKNWKKGS